MVNNIRYVKISGQLVEHLLMNRMSRKMSLFCPTQNMLVSSLLRHLTLCYALSVYWF